MKSSMKIILSGSLLALSAAVPLTALAAPPKAHTTQRHEDATTGAITSITAQEVKLASGDTFKLKPGVSAANFKAGDKVKVQWTMKDGAKQADKISAVKN